MREKERLREIEREGREVVTPHNVVILYKQTKQPNLTNVTK